MSSEQKPPIGHTVQLSEMDCLKLENMLLKKKMLEAQLNAIVMEENEFHRSLQDRLKIDPSYQIDIEKRQAVKVRP